MPVTNDPLNMLQFHPLHLYLVKNFRPMFLLEFQTSCWSLLTLIKHIGFYVILSLVGPERDTKSVWGFGFKSSVPSSATWSVPGTQQSSDWSRSNHVSGGSNKTSPTNEMDDDVIEINSNDNLQTVLERLSLAEYLSNFQVSHLLLGLKILLSVFASWKKQTVSNENIEYFINKREVKL